MSPQYAFRLIGADRPDGEIDVEDAVQILSKLQEVATRIGRVAADASHRGRPSSHVDRVSRLRLTALAQGSTVIQVSRASQQAELDFDLAEERDFDRRFDALISGIVSNDRPADVNESIGSSVADLIAAIRRAAPRLEVKVDGESRGETSTDALEPDVWKPASRVPEEFVVEGVLEKVDIRSGDFRVRDAMGVSYSLPRVQSVADASLLIGRTVRVEGTAERNERSEIVAVRSATVVAAPDHIGQAGVGPAVSLETLLKAKRQVGVGEPQHLSFDEQDSFMEVMGF